MKGNIAFDLDQTLDRLPGVFGGMISASRNAGMNTYLITGRPETDRARTEKELLGMGIDPLSFTDIMFFPETYTFTSFTSGTILKIASWKASMCKALSINILFEDNVRTIGEVKRYSPDTIISLII